MRKIKRNKRMKKSFLMKFQSKFFKYFRAKFNRLKKENQEFEYEVDDLKRKNKELLDQANEKENGILQKINEQEFIIEELIAENSNLMIDLYEFKKQDFLHLK